MQTERVNGPREEIAVPFPVVLSAACAAEMQKRRGSTDTRPLTNLSAQWRGQTIEVCFAPGGASLAAATGTLPAAVLAPSRCAATPVATTYRRRVRIDWYTLGVVSLMLSSTVAAAIKLMAAMPPG